MKEILVLRFAEHEGPGYLAESLDRNGLPWRLVRIDRGDPVPDHLEGVSGLALMGGPMSANDTLSWIPRVRALVRRAAGCDLPLLGHCLGAQLIAQALGGEITRNPVPEIGWLPVRIADTPSAARYFGGLPARLELFHWHGETFSLPAGAELLLSSARCAHQGFALGRTLALQCHVEVTAGMVRDWVERATGELDAPCATVQSAGELLADLERRLADLRRVADAVYGRWFQGIDATGSSAPRTDSPVEPPR